MARIKSHKAWLHPSSVTEDLDFALGTAAPTIRVAGVVSSKAKPKSLKSVLICLDADETKRIEKRLSLLGKSKKRIAQLRVRADESAEKAKKLKSENFALDSRISDLEEHIRNLEYNLEILNKNLNDRELLIRSARGEGLSTPSGLGKLSDRGAIGLPLQGGLPSLGKKSK